MRIVLLGAFLVVGLLAGCDAKSKEGTGAPLPPSKEVQTKNKRGKVVLDELPPPPVRQK